MSEEQITTRRLMLMPFFSSPESRLELTLPFYGPNTIMGIVGGVLGTPDLVLNQAAIEEMPDEPDQEISFVMVKNGPRPEGLYVGSVGLSGSIVHVFAGSLESQPIRKEVVEDTLPVESDYEVGAGT